jgi:peptidyl-prolyl cis-trans isomerase A (cyclophilin A)
MRLEMKKTAIILATLLFCANFLLAQTTPKKTTTSSTTASRRTATPKPSLLNPATLKAQAPAVYKAKFTTTKGDFVIEVTRAWAPLGADRFYNLVKNGFYTDAAFFRILPGFVAQVGIPAKPEIARVWSQAHIADDPVTQSNLKGFVTFATAGPNTRTTQIFINYADNTGLDGMGFAPFGKIVEGMEVVEGLYADYGEGAPRGNGPDQGRITNEGKVYLDKEFPKLDTIKAAVIVGEAPPAAAAAKTPSKAAGASTAKPAATKTTTAPKETK